MKTRSPLVFAAIAIVGLILIVLVIRIGEFNAIMAREHERINDRVTHSGLEERLRGFADKSHASLFVRPQETSHDADDKDEP
jgi:hypothetical protein